MPYAKDDSTLSLTLPLKGAQANSFNSKPDWEAAPMNEFNHLSLVREALRDARARPQEALGGDLRPNRADGSTLVTTAPSQSVVRHKTRGV